MSKIGDIRPDDGGPAFPSTGEGFGDPRYHTPGASLWDFYAAHALTGVPANYGGGSATEAAERAASIADAILAQRKKRWP